MTARTPRGKKVGRKVSLDPQRQAKIVEAIEAGNYLDTAARLGGISPAGFYKWMDRGNREIDRLTVDPTAEPDPDEVPFVEFVEAVERAKATAEGRNVAIIQKAAITTWQAAAWWLERTRPKKFARLEKSEVTGPEGGAVRIDVSTEDLERKVTAILDKRSAG